MKMSIVIPCFNESKNISLIFNRFSEVMGNRDIEVVFVNNGSLDNSKMVFEKFLPAYPFAKVVNVEINQGYGFGIISGLKAAEGDYIGWTHADMQTDPEDVIRAYDYIVKKSNDIGFYLKGNRKGRPLFDTLFTVCMGMFESALFNTWLTDINAQPNVFPKSFFKTWKEPPFDFSLDLYALVMAKKEGLTLVRFPVNFPERKFGSSKWNTGFISKIRFIKRTLNYSFKLKRRVNL